MVLCAKHSVTGTAQPLTRSRSVLIQPVTKAAGKKLERAQHASLANLMALEEQKRLGNTDRRLEPTLTPHTRRLYLAYYRASTAPGADDKAFVAFILMPRDPRQTTNKKTATRYYIHRPDRARPFAWTPVREKGKPFPPHLVALLFLGTVPSDKEEGDVAATVSQVPIKQNNVKFSVVDWVRETLDVRFISLPKLCRYAEDRS